MDLGKKNQSLCSASVLRGEVQELLPGGLRGSFLFSFKVFIEFVTTLLQFYVLVFHL